MSRLLHLKSLLPLLLAALVFATYSQSQEPPTESQASQIAPVALPQTDGPTLNLHRWGAVTLFHGLPSDRVNAIAEDAAGLMWFGTDNGLVRYDGRNVETAPGENVLPARRILALQLDVRGTLWIGTEAGAARWRDNQMEMIAETRNHAITGIATAANKDVLLVSAQGELFRCQEVSQEQIRSENLAAQRLTVTKLDQTNFPLLRAPSAETATLPLTAVVYSPTGEWRIGSTGRGLLLQQGQELHEATARPPRPYFVSALYQENDRTWLAEAPNQQTGGLWLWSSGALTRTNLDTGNVTALHGGANELWVGTGKRGVFLLDSQRQTSEPLEHLTFENTAGGLRSNHINTLFRDRGGVVWFGTDRGVCRYDRNSFRASSISDNAQSNFVRTLLATNAGAIWCGTNHGLFLQPASAEFGSWAESSELKGRSVYALIEDAAGTVWVGSNSGLFAKAKTAENFVRLPVVPETTVTITNESAANSATPDAPPPPTNTQENPAPSAPNVAPSSRESVRALANFRGHLYAAFFERGIERLDGAQRTLVLGEKAAQRAICLAAEGEQALWFGTSEGELWRYDGAQTRQIPLAVKTAGERAVRALRFAGGRLWFGTAQGLFVLEGDVPREVLPEVDVRGLLVQGQTPDDLLVWCATQNAGLLKLRPTNNLSARFDSEQGLPSQQVFALAEKQDALWIGTSRGVVEHHPSATEPQLIVKRLVADRIYQDDYLMTELSLPHTQPNFLLEVTGLGSKTFPSQFQYEFTLQNLKNEVLRKVTTHAPQFAYSGLQSGAYRVTVRAISRDLIYSAPLVVRLRVAYAPFPWGTLLLASLLTVAVIAAVWAFRQQRRLSVANRALNETNLELRETRLRLANETETERSRIARDLHDQTLADLRHLLVLTDQLPQPVQHDAATPTPAVIRKEIEAISSEIRHICEDLSPSVLENVGFLPALEWALADAVAHLPAAEKFAYEFNCEADLEERMQLAPSEQIQLYRIVQEALNNICRHAHAKHVTMSVRSENETALLIEIQDDGVGFDGIPTSKIGHGLANIRSRANLISALISWQNTRPGCRFVVQKTSALSVKET